MENRRKVVPMTPELLAQILMTGERHYRVIAGLPGDARVVSAWSTHDYRNSDAAEMLRFLVESESFEPVGDGESYPEMIIRFEEIPA